ncbi:hypothetical protein Sa4125_17580 [Aureimonas sp. SA4125]|nr:hypothetical protein Sa4125_17580 [Aureimonas sp. SA4125]
MAAADLLEFSKVNQSRPPIGTGGLQQPIGDRFARDIGCYEGNGNQSRN